MTLKAGKPVDIPIYDFATHSRSKETQHFERKTIILLDGILIFHPKEICELLDLKIFIETAEPVRFERRLKRDVSERGRTPDGVREQYNLTVKPMHDKFVEPSKHQADLRLSGERKFADQIDRVMERI
jgi:uridine kinase